MDEPIERGLELADGTLPTARSIAAELKDQLNRAVLVERERRGSVALIEDTWPMHRALNKVIETCGEYARAFSAAAKEAGLVVEEELIDIVGEKDGVPNQGTTVPDPDDNSSTVTINNTCEVDSVRGQFTRGDGKLSTLLKQVATAAFIQSRSGGSP